MPQNNYRILFDLDDTLLSCSYRYRAAGIKVLDFIQNLIIPYPIDSTVMADNDTNQCELIKSSGFHRHVFADAWCKTTGDILDKLELELDPGRRDLALQKVRTIASTCYDPPYYLLPGVSDLMSWLMKNNLPYGTELFIITVGDSEVQSTKIALSGLDQYFPKKNIRIVKENKEHEIQKLSKNRRKTIMIGNSMSSDIVPALNCNIEAIYIPFGGWLYDNSVLENADAPKYHLLKDISQLPQLLTDLLK